MAIVDLEKFSSAKPIQKEGSAVISGQVSLDDYMRETFGCEATALSEFPSDEADLTIVFDSEERI